MTAEPHRRGPFLGLEAVIWDESWGPAGDVLDRLLTPGQFVLTEPDMSEFVCADHHQLQTKLGECEARGIEPCLVRWRRSDGSIERYVGRPPSGWGVEDGASR